MTAQERPGPAGASELRTVRTQHPPVRMAHLGLGAFHRTHQAWYTQRANDATTGDDPWGIAAFTVRSPRAAELLSGNDHLFSLLERSAAADRVEIVQSIVAAVPGSDEDAWLRTLADPEVQVLTVTVTEAGHAPDSLPVRRIAAALAARTAHGAPPLTIISCDNLSRNGQTLRDAVAVAGGDDGPELAASASFVDTVVDRITPATTAEDVSTVEALTGYADPATVVAEPFGEWVLSGDLSGGIPAWADVGALVVTDIAPYEQRKLWLLNAGHSFLAAAGRLAGYDTISEAFDDPRLKAETESLWTAQRVGVALPAEELDEWLDQLRSRFANPRIAHRLDQISAQSPRKVSQRLVAPIRRGMHDGARPTPAQEFALDTWVRSLLTLPPIDESAARLTRALSSMPSSERIPAIIAHLTSEGELA